ncbi:uncharacterized protein LOC132791389 [Drosophila nasuta]|uniref:uncharacterized protein LOC132791389 n=1 Tax=Drosophila nasuta TaxID=42062 RepID=UPI00295F33F5|nr:uncharacterized protein LOC132791389 [Drosophila nasuta]
MDGPIISIYDMLRKRYRQQKKEEQLQQEIFPIDGRRPTYPTRKTETKKLKMKSSRSKMVSTPKEKSTKMTTNVVTATHLTKKRSRMLIPALAKKEVLNDLIERMTMPAKKSEEKLINESSGSTESTLNTVVTVLKKTKPAVPTKPNVVKMLPGSASTAARRRLALSPRNMNTLATPKLKREKQLKPKAMRKNDANNPTDALRPKRRLQTNKSMSLIQVKSELKPDSNAEDNAMRYRL